MVTDKSGVRYSLNAIAEFELRDKQQVHNSHYRTASPGLIESTRRLFFGYNSKSRQGEMWHQVYIYVSVQSQHVVEIIGNDSSDHFLPRSSVDADYST